MASEIEMAVEAAFARFAQVYGMGALDRFTRGMDVPALKVSWAHELRGFTSLDVFYAMDHLPQWGIPNLMEFKELCRRRPMPVPLALKGPKASPERVAAVLEELAKVRKTLVSGGGNRATDWQAKLLERYARGDTRLTKFQRDICVELLAKKGSA